MVASPFDWAKVSKLLSGAPFMFSEVSAPHSPRHGAQPHSPVARMSKVAQRAGGVLAEKYGVESLLMLVKQAVHRIVGPHVAIDEVCTANVRLHLAWTCIAANCMCFSVVVIHLFLCVLALQ